MDENIIQEYSFGRIKINNTVFTKDIVVSKNSVYPNWWRKEGHKLYVEDIKDYIEKENPKIVIIGTGFYGMMKVQEETIIYLKRKKITLIVEKTKSAIDKYNRLLKEKEEKILGFFHLTC